MHDFLARWASLEPTRDAIRDVDRGRTWTYRYLDERASRLGTALRDGLELARGDRVAWISEPRAELFEAYFATAKRGLVLVPLNTRLAAPKLAAIVGDAAPAVLVYDDAFAPLVDEMFRVAGGALDTIRGVALGRIRVRAEDRDYDALIEAGALGRDETITLEQVTTILYTSGTTGLPKGVEIPWRQVVFNAVNTALATGMHERDACLSTLPLFHTGGLHCVTTPTLHAGGTVVLTSAFAPDRAAALLRSGAIQTTIAVPTMYAMLAEHGLADAPVPGLRSLLCGGAPCPHALIERYHAAKLPFRQGYGLTEVGPNCFTLSPLEGPHRVGSVGRPAFHGEVRLVDGHGLDVMGDAPGELLLRGPHVTTGYFRRPSETARAIDSDGWFHTGDVLRRTEDGVYYVVGRQKDMFISGGENVYPGEVELCIAAHPAVASVAVLPVEDARWGQVGLAAVVLREARDGSLDEASIQAWVRSRLARYEVPAHVRFVDALPLNASGKVDREALRRAVAG